MLVSYRSLFSSLPSTSDLQDKVHLSQAEIAKFSKRNNEKPQSSNNESLRVFDRHAQFIVALKHVINKE